MLCETFQKGEKKKKSRRKAVPESVMKIVRERSVGVCEYCGHRIATDPHHICEIGMGGGNRLDIPINILHVCRICHNHDTTKFIEEANVILRERIEELFKSYSQWTIVGIAANLKVDGNIIVHQYQKGFLKGNKDSRTGVVYFYTGDIKRWLGVA